MMLAPGFSCAVFKSSIDVMADAFFVLQTTKTSHYSIFAVKASKLTLGVLKSRPGMG